MHVTLIHPLPDPVAATTILVVFGHRVDATWVLWALFYPGRSCHHLSALVKKIGPIACHRISKRWPALQH